MHSQSRIFSQEGELSQLSSDDLFSQNCSNNIKNGLHNEGAQSCSKSPVSQANDHEEPLSLRADDICKENKQIGNLVMNDLKKLENKRIRFMNTKEKIEETEQKEIEIHERQSRKLIDFQMNLEKVSEQRRNNLEQRPELLYKLKKIQYIGDVLQEKVNENIISKENLKKSETYLQSELEKSYSYKIKTKEKKKIINEEFNVEWDRFVKTSQDEMNAIINERKNRVCEIQTLVLQNEEDLNETQIIEIDFNNETANLNTTIHKNYEMAQQKKMFTGENLLFRQDLYDSRSINATLIQNIKLQINTEQHNKSNHETKCKENEDYLNNRAKKLKACLDLLKQLKTNVEETSNNNEDKQNKNKSCQERNTFLKNENNSLFEVLKGYGNVEIDNTSLKTDINTFDDIIEVNRSELESKEEEVQHLKNKYNSLLKQLNIIETSIVQLDEKLNIIIKNKEESTAKFNQDKLFNQQERENKINRNQNIGDTINRLSCEEEELAKNIKECNESISSLKLQEHNIKHNIMQTYKETEQNKTKLFNEEKAFTEYTLNMDEINSNDNDILDQHEELLIQLKPEQDELALNIELNISLDQTLNDQVNIYKETCRNLEENFNLKIKELESDMEKYCPIMDSLIAAEEEATAKIKKEIKDIEDIKIKLKANVIKLHEHLQTIINVEQEKRSKIVKLEKKLKEIRKETVAKHQHIRDWNILGKAQTPIKRSSTHLMTPNSSADSLRNLKHSQPIQRVTDTAELGFKQCDYNQQIKTLKWVESVPVDDDEYEFTEL